jgi:predicted acylesterase/phospholipase RssA
MATVVDMLEHHENKYDVISGVSVGSINALGFSIFDYGEEQEMIETMVGVWTNLTDDNVFRKWP